MTRNTRLMLAVSAALMLPAMAYAADDRAGDRNDAQVVVKDSTITSQIKAALADEHVRSLKHIDVDTDDHGVVKLSGHVQSQQDMDTAVAIARRVDGVRKVENNLRIKQGD